MQNTASLIGSKFIFYLFIFFARGYFRHVDSWTQNLNCQVFEHQFATARPTELQLILRMFGKLSCVGLCFFNLSYHVKKLCSCSQCLLATPIMSCCGSRYSTLIEVHRLWISPDVVQSRSVKNTRLARAPIDLEVMLWVISFTSLFTSYL